MATLGEHLGNLPRQLLEKFLYQRLGDKEAAFRTFRRYSRVHLETARRLAALITEQSQGKDSLSVLDIGTGDQEFPELVITEIGRRQVHPHTRFNFTWLELEESNVRSLQNLADRLPKSMSARIVENLWQQYRPGQFFDVIIASHFIYYLSTREFEPQIVKMIDTLKPGGYLFFEARTVGDDDDAFIRMFHERANGKVAPKETIESVYDTLWEIRRDKATNAQFDITYSTHENFIDIPLDPKLPDFSNLMQFYLLVGWKDMVPPNTDARLQDDIMVFLRDRGGKLFEREGNIIVRKAPNVN